MSQQMEALQIANGVRSACAQVRQELTVGLLTIGQALEDPRAERMQIGRMLCAQRRWGPGKADRLLGKLQIWPTKYAGDLTERQKALILEALQR